MACLAAVVSVVTVAVAHASGSGGAVVEEQAVRATPPDRALVVSDSAWLAIHSYGTMDAVQGFDHTLALASCRRRVAASCRNYDGFVPATVLEVLVADAGRHSTLVVATGYNDSDHAFAGEFEQIVGAARSLGYERIVWLTLRSSGVTYQSPDDAGYAEVFDRVNATLAGLVASGRHPDVVIADWARYARDRPEWFAPDGIHLRRTGTYAASDYLSRKMAFLDGRACPRPSAEGVAVQSPCPDPDVTGPVVDLAGVYPLDRSAPRQPFSLEFVGHGSWPDLPWWER